MAGPRVKYTPRGEGTAGRSSAIQRQRRTGVIPDYRVEGGVKVKYSPKMSWLMRRMGDEGIEYILLGKYPHYTITGERVTEVATPEIMRLPDHDVEFNNDV